MVRLGEEAPVRRVIRLKQFDHRQAEMPMRAFFRTLILVFASLVCVAGGCGKSGPPMYQVRGKVHYKDGSIPQASVCLVNFVPAKDSKAEVRRNATGAIGPDGTFTMFTRVNGDGVNAGEYDVLFNVAKNPMAPVSLLLPKYTNHLSPPYKVTVDHRIDDLEYTIEPLPGVSTAAAAKSGGAQ
jgi:hypothetical protein